MNESKMSDLEKEARSRLGMLDDESTSGAQKKFKEVQSEIKNAGENESDLDDDDGAPQGDTTGPLMPEPGKKSDQSMNENPLDYIRK